MSVSLFSRKRLGHTHGKEPYNIILTVVTAKNTIATEGTPAPQNGRKTRPEMGKPLCRNESYVVRQKE